MIDNDGYRLNVGIILTNQAKQVLWAKRIGQSAWQFPQGGIKVYETPQQALMRELYEELGLTAKHVHLLGSTKGWLYYRLPSHLIRYHQRPLCIGQKQVWYLLGFTGQATDIQLHNNTTPEFDQWSWVDYWHPLSEVVYFKHKVYETALKELNPLATQFAKQPEKTTSTHPAPKKRVSPKTAKIYYA